MTANPWWMLREGGGSHASALCSLAANPTRWVRGPTAPAEASVLVADCGRPALWLVMVADLKPDPATQPAVAGGCLRLKAL
jgi:hypothetical protein